MVEKGALLIQEYSNKKAKGKRTLTESAKNGGGGDSMERSARKGREYVKERRARWVGSAQRKN
jgi:hypothetical protein